MKKTLYQSFLIFCIAALSAFATNHFRRDRLPLWEDWSPEVRLATLNGKNMLIPLSEAVSVFHSGEAIFVDARAEVFYRHGHIRGAVNIPLEDVDKEPDRLLALLPDRKRRIITYCDGKTCMLAEKLAMKLVRSKYEQVKILVNGWTSWKEAGYPTEKGIFNGT